MAAMRSACEHGVPLGAAEQCWACPKKRPVGRPPAHDDDKRREQRIYSRNEWAEVKRRADAAGMTRAAYVRSLTLKGWAV